MVRCFNLRSTLILCFFLVVFSVANAQQVPLPLPSGYIGSYGPGDPLLYLTDAVISGNYLYAIGSQNKEFSVVDISNPREPEVVATLYDGDGGAIMKGPRALFVSGNLAYIVSDNMLTPPMQSLSLEIIDISDPTNPTHKGSLVDTHGDYPYNEPGPYLFRASDIAVSGNYAYISCHYGLEIVDVSDPANPVHKSNLYSFPSATPPTPPDMYFEFVEAVQVQGNYAYLLGKLGNDNGFMSVDISDPANPAMVGFLAHGTISAGPILTNPSGMEVVGDYAYVISLNNALEILDISDPAAPAHLSFVKNNNPTGTVLDFPIDIDVDGDFAYITSQNASTIEIVDISDPAAPEHATTILNGDNGQPPFIGGGTIDIVDNFAYIGSIGMQVMSIFTPGPPEVRLGVTAQVGEIEKSVSFKAGWKEIAGLTYTLEVSADDFVTRLPGYDNVTATGVFAQGGSGPNDKEMLVSGLNPNTTYKFRMKAINANGASETSVPISVTTAPAAPVATAATAIKHDGAMLNWQAVPGATQYLVYLYGGNDLSPAYVFDGYPAGNVTSFDVSGILSPSSNYSFWIRAGNTNGESPTSNNPQFLTAPTFTTLLSASSVTETSFVANWSDDPSANVTGYFLDVATNIDIENGDFTGMVTGYNNLDVGDVTSKLVNTGLTAGTMYYYRVRTGNTSGSSPNSSNPIVVTTAPLPPVLGDATEITTSSFKANWTAAVGATGYRIDVSTNDGFTSFVPLYNDKALPVSPTSVTVSGLVAGTSYFYRVRAVNAGTSGAAGLKEVVTVPTAPGATAASQIGGTTFTANWASVQSASQYFVDVSTDISFATLFDGFDNLAVAGTTLGVTGLSVNTTYYYRVRAANASGLSVNSNAITVLTAPIAPAATAASGILHDRATLNWQSVPGATKYLVYLYDHGNLGSPNSAFNGFDVGNVTTFEVADPSISPATNYKFRVKATNGAESIFSNAIDFTTRPGYTTFLPATSVTATSFIARWNDDAAIVTGFFLDVATDATFTQIIADYDNLDVGDVTSKLVNTGLSAGTTYYYRVRTANATGSSPNSPNPTSVSTIPLAPTLNSATATTTTSFMASWNAATGATGYRIDVSTNEAFSSFVPTYNDKAVGPTPTELEVAALVAGTTYFYRIRAQNSGGTSDSQGLKEVVTLPVAPVAIAGSQVGETVFTANWATVQSATLYSLEVSTDVLFATTVNDVEVSGLTQDVTGLSVNTTYYYRVRAANASGLSTYSNSITVTTAPTAPEATVASGIEHNRATLNWQSVPGATKYFIYLYDQGNLGSPNPAFNSYDVGNVTSFEVSGSSISPATNYKFRIKATNGAASTFSNAIDFTTKPTYTTFLPATLVTASSFTANWNDDPAIITGFFLDVATEPTFTQLLTDYDNLNVGDVTSKLVNTGLSAGGTYYYRLRTANASGSSPNSPSAISVSTTPPAPMLNAATDIETTSFKARWNTVTGATGYRIDVSANEAFSGFVPTYNDRSVTTTDVDVTGLLAGTSYYYRVRATNSGGTSDTQGVMELITRPVAPFAASATQVGQTVVTANWATVPSATHYFLDVSTDPSFGTFVVGFNDFQVNGSSAGITGLSASTTYYYRVRAANASGSSASSNTITVLTAPTAPVATEAQLPTQTSFVAKWNEVSSATAYKVDVSAESTFPSFVPGFEGATATTPSLNVSGLVPGSTYYYRVRATNGSGSSDNSNVISQITVPATPITAIAEAISQTSFTAKWTAVTGASKYLVDVMDASETVLTGFDDLEVTTGTSLLVSTSIVPGTEYSYVVKAFNAAGTTPASEARAVLTFPPTPEGLPAAISGTVNFTAKWTASLSATKYTIVVANDELFNSIVPGYNSFDILGGNILQTLVTVNAPTTGATYYYKVSATNGSGTSPFSASIQVNTPATSFQSILLPTGGTTESYMIISIPEGTTASTTLAAESFLTSWRVMHYENDGTGNVDFRNISQMEAGKGYWMNSSLSEAPAITLGGQTLPVAQSLTLHPGWNQIGNPFNFSISWEDVLTKNTTVTSVGDLYTYNVPSVIGDFVTYDGLMGFGGGFVNSTSTTNVTLEIPVDVERFNARKNGAGRFAIAGRDIAANEWFLPITLEAGGKVNNLGGVGMHPDAHSSIDRFDAVALPRFFNRPSLSSLHSEFFQPHFMKDVVPTAESHSWTLDISTPDEQSDARLTWDNKGWGNANLYLVDEAAGVVLDMSESDWYAFDTRKTKSVTFIFGRGTTLAPDITALGQPFPNPSADRVAFPFIARDGENFSIHIVDLTGKTVGSMTIDRATAGYNEAVWNSLEGGNLPPGIYLYKFTSSTGIIKSGKIVLK